MEPNGSAEGPQGKTWVQFSEENETENSQTLKDTNKNVAPAVIEPSVEIHSSAGPKSLPVNNVHSGNLQTVELHNSLENNVHAGSTTNNPVPGSTSARGTANGSRRNNSGFSMLYDLYNIVLQLMAAYEIL